MDVSKHWISESGDCWVQVTQIRVKKGITKVSYNVVAANAWFIKRGAWKVWVIIIIWPCKLEYLITAIRWSLGYILFAVFHEHIFHYRNHPLLSPPKEMVCPCHTFSIVALLTKKRNVICTQMVWIASLISHTFMTILNICFRMSHYSSSTNTNHLVANRRMS